VRLFSYCCSDAALLLLLRQVEVVAESLDQVLAGLAVVSTADVATCGSDVATCDCYAQGADYSCCVVVLLLF
jgi:hypothetical protein